MNIVLSDALPPLAGAALRARHPHRQGGRAVDDVWCVRWLTVVLPLCWWEMLPHILNEQQAFDHIPLTVIGLPPPMMQAPRLAAARVTSALCATLRRSRTSGACVCRLCVCVYVCVWLPCCLRGALPCVSSQGPGCDCSRLDRTGRPRCHGAATSSSCLPACLSLSVWFV